MDELDDRRTLNDSEAWRSEVARLGLEFLAEFLAVDAARHPDNVAALIELGHVYTRLGKYAEGLEVDQRLVRLAPECPSVHYNLACSLALLGEGGGALDALERAIELGYDDIEFLVEDEDLRSLRDEARFRELVGRLQARLRD